MGSVLYGKHEHGCSDTSAMDERDIVISTHQL